jgi:hypothetical protein
MKFPYLLRIICGTFPYLVNPGLNKWGSITLVGFEYVSILTIEHEILTKSLSQLSLLYYKGTGWERQNIYRSHKPLLLHVFMFLEFKFLYLLTN